MDEAEPRTTDLDTGRSPSVGHTCPCPPFAARRKPRIPPARPWLRLPRQGHLWNSLPPPRQVDSLSGLRPESHAALPRLIGRCDQLPTFVSSRDISIARAEWVSAPTEM